MSSNSTLENDATPEQHLLELKTFITQIETLNDEMEVLVGWADVKFGAAERSRSNELMASATEHRPLLPVVKWANVVLSRTMDDVQKEALAELLTALADAEQEMVTLMGELGKILAE